MPLILSNSSSVRLCWLTRSGVMAGSLMEGSVSRCLGHAALQPACAALKNRPPVRRPQDDLAGPLRMGHEARDIAGFIADAGDVAQRTIRIAALGQLALGVGVLPENSVVLFQLLQGGLVREVAALAVGDGQAQDFSGRNLVREGRLVRGGLEKNMFAAKLERAISNERAGQQARFAEDL